MMVTWQFKFGQFKFRQLKFLWKFSNFYISKYNFKLKKKTCQVEEIIKDYKIKNSKKNLKIKLLEDILYKF